MNALTEYRINNGNISQAELAKLLGTTKASISRYENGQRKIALFRVHEISKLTNIPLSDLRPDVFGELRS